MDDWLARWAPVLQPSPPVRGPVRPRPDVTWRMRAQDAFFAQVDSEGLRQQVCLVLELEDVAPGRPLDVEELRQVVAPRVLGLAPLRRRWVAGPPLGWLCAPVNIADHVIECRMDALETVEDRVDRFLSETLPGDRPGWQMLLVHSADDPRTVLAVQLHHVYGDGISALSLLDRLLTPAPGDPLRERRAAARPRRRAWGPRPALHLAGRVSRGPAGLAAHGTAPTHPLTARPTGPGRRLVTVRLPLSTLRQMASRHGARGHEVRLTVLADALRRTLRPAGLLQPGSPLRVMVPVAMRLPRLGRIFGNWTGSVALDLPLDPMPFGQRLAMVRSEIRHRSDRGEPLAAEVVLRVAGRLPGPLPRWFARAVYSRRFFNSIVSYMPMTRGPRWCAGAKVRAMYPVLPLTRGVPLTVGVILTDDTVCLGVLLDDTLPLTRAGLAEAVQAAWAAAVMESG